MADSIKVAVDKKTNELVIRCKLNGKKPSKSGKMDLIATTHGFMTSDAEYDGLPVRLSLNAGVSAS